MRKTTTCNISYIVLALGLVSGCGVESSPSPATTAGAEEQPLDEPEHVVSGRLHFAVDSQPVEMTEFDAADTFYTRVSSKIAGRTSDGQLRLSLTFLAVDLRGLSYPIVLPPKPTASGQRDPKFFMTSIGYSLQHENGSEWTGTAPVTLDLFTPDGRLSGTFDTVELRDVDDKTKLRSLQGGQFSVSIGGS